jgi:uncharacterized protein (DUF58 family)
MFERLTRLRRRAAPRPSGAAANLLARLSFVRRARTSGGMGGEHQGRARAPSLEFVDYRQYRPGDDPRRVDWNAYARLGTLQVRLTESQEREHLVLVVDRSASMRWGRPDKYVYASQLAAALGTLALARAETVHLAWLPGPAEPDPARTFAARERLPELVQLLDRTVPAGRVHDLGAALAGVLAAVPVPARASAPLVVVLSDLLATPDGGSLADGLDGLGARGADVVVLHLLSPREFEPRAQGEVELEDAETGEVLPLDVSRTVLAAYRQRLTDWLDGVESTCLSRGARYVRVRTDRPLEALLLEDLRHAGVLR